MQQDMNMRGGGGEAMSLQDFMNDLAAGEYLLARSVNLLVWF